MVNCHQKQFLSDQSRVSFVYDDDDEYDDDRDFVKIIHKADYGGKEQHYDKGDDHFEAIPHIKFNSLIGILILLGVLILPMAIAAEINIDAISAQIADLSRLLTTYYTSLTRTLDFIIVDLATIMADLTTLRNTVNANSNTLQTIITLINNIPIGRSVDIDYEGDYFNLDISADSFANGYDETENDATGYEHWYISQENPGLNDSSVDAIAKLETENATGGRKILKMCLKAAQSQKMSLVI